MNNAIDVCDIDKENDIAFIKFFCGFELRIEDDKIIYKINNQSTIKPNTEKNRLEMYKEVEKNYNEIIRDSTMYFFIRTKI